MAKTYMDADMDAELEGIEDSDEEMEQDKNDEKDDDDESDDELMDDEFDKETLEKISNLESELESNPYNYSAYTDLIAILRKGSDFDKLRAVRQKFRANYPLSPQLWMDWTQDEMKIAASEEDKQMICDLFDAGSKDYVSVDLWLEYCKYSLGDIGTSEGMEKARNVFERSLTACGLHTGKASLLWDSYREFEMALMAMQGSEEAQTKQKTRVINLMKRQLRVPLMDMDKTLGELEVLLGEKPDPNVIRDFHKAKEKLKKIEQFEVAILNNNESTLESYKEYLKFELKEKDPARIQLLYERAITDNCLEPTLWEDYLSYLDTNLRIDSVSLPVYERAVRNCPWSHNIWSDYLLSLERYEKEHKLIKKVFEDCLSVGFREPTCYLEVWLTYVSYMRRKTDFKKTGGDGGGETESMTELRQVLERACEHLVRVSGDPECVMLKFYANLEADQLGSLENARKIWTDILAVHPFKTSVWMEAIEFEKIFGDKKHLRKRLERAMEKSHDNPEAIAHLWLMFEREEGSLEAFDHCRKMIKLKMDKMENLRAKEKRENDAVEEREKAKKEKKIEKDKQYRRDKRHLASEQKKADREKTKPTENFKVPTLPGPTTTKKVVEPPPGFPGGDVTASKKRAVEPPPGYPGDGAIESNKKQKLDPNLSEEEVKQLRTVFLSNLDFDVDEDMIEKLMENSGNVTEVRLVKHPDGKSKGYAFVEFSTPDEAENAKKRDNELVKGRPMYISECDPSRKKGHVFKYSTGLDKKKLFVKGLDSSVTKADLGQVFGQYGELSDVRLVTYRNGHSKGIAFVEYKDEVDAARALVKTDGMKIKDKKVEVAISNPPKRKDESEPADMKSLGGTQQKDFGPRGKGRSQLAFMPRSLTSSVPATNKKLDLVKFVKPAAKPSAENGAKVADNGANSAENGAKTAENGAKTADNDAKTADNGAKTADNGAETTETKEPVKSNSDFRKMLLGSK